MAKSNSPIEHLAGTIERVTFHSEESGFAVLKVKVSGKRDLMCVVGHVIQVSAGEYIDCSGTWINNKEYGLQFQASNIKIVMPQTLEGIEKYLGSGLIKGIGPHFAKILVQAFGDKVFDIIEHEPQRLKELHGIGAHRQERILSSWSDQKVIREIIIFLHSHGVGTARAVRIYKTYGKDAIAKVTENPYRLALDIRGIGFKTADNLAIRLGIAKDSMIRAQAGVCHVLQELCSVGNCAVEREELIETAVKLLEIESTKIEEAIREEEKAERIIQEYIEGKVCFFPASLYFAELGVVKHLKRLKEGKLWTEGIHIENAIPWVESKTKLELSSTQKDALRVALQNKIVIITGGPGVGKTTLINSLLKILQTKTAKILLCAPTGRAAKRMSESTQSDAKTLHRLLEFDAKKYDFKRNQNNPLDAQVVVVDEMSMVDLNLMYSLLKAIPNEATLILVGDVDQLPSVGPGAVLSNLIDSGFIATVRLTEIFRQAKSSQIVVNAHRINQGDFPYFSKQGDQLSDFYFVEANTPENIYEKLMHVVMHRIPKRFGFDPIREIQVLVPMNRGGLGVRSLNSELQKQLNPNQTVYIERFGSRFGISDKVIQTVNNYDKEVFNGDIGFITHVDPEEGLLEILFEGRHVEYDASELDELSLAYATTIHKAQGSEYPAVVIPITTQHYTLLERNLLYTGVTRGKSLVVVIGQAKALAMAIRTVRSSKRLTNLKTRLAELV